MPESTKPKSPETENGCQAVCGDCLDLLCKLKEPPSLIVADPPYDFAQPYDVYVDHKGYDKYMAWTLQWLSLSAEVLHKWGALWVFCPEEWVSEIDLICRKVLRLHRRRHVVWAFTFGQKAQKNFTRAHVHLLYFCKTKTRFVFNTPAVCVPSARQLVYNDSRAVAGGKPPDDVWMLLKSQLELHMTSDTDTWLESRICGTYRERQAHAPNQIPVPLMERIVLATSNPGDLVVDPFCGTGSSGLACLKYNRRWAGFDISCDYVDRANARLQSAVRLGAPGQ